MSKQIGKGSEIEPKIDPTILQIITNKKEQKQVAYLKDNSFVRFRDLKTNTILRSSNIENINNCYSQPERYKFIEAKEYSELEPAHLPKKYFFQYEHPFSAISDAFQVAEEEQEESHPLAKQKK